MQQAAAEAAKVVMSGHKNVFSTHRPGLRQGDTGARQRRTPGRDSFKGGSDPEYELVFNSEDKIAENIQDIKVPVRIGQLYLLLRESQPCLFLSQNL